MINVTVFKFNQINCSLISKMIKSDCKVPTL